MGKPKIQQPNFRLSQWQIVGSDWKTQGKRKDIHAQALSMQPNGAAGTVTLLIKSYLKPNDSVTMVFNQQQKAVQSLQVASYLSDPSDAVTIAVQFAKLRDGTNHAATIQVNGVSKQLGVAIQNSTYQSI